ncbi:MAG TPA: zf-HC2 domain-containing protein [Thermoanaerobaculia bacterium]|nr:zf-HC2 domain-containing protein [Thermoanaerobaculia bacterium]
MLCNDVKRVVYFFLDGSLGEVKQRDYKTHLSICPDCEKRTTVSRKLRDFVRRRLGRDNAPDRLKIRLTRSIRAIVIE